MPLEMNAVPNSFWRDCALGSCDYPHVFFLCLFRELVWSQYLFYTNATKNFHCSIPYYIFNASLAASGDCVELPSAKRKKKLFKTQLSLFFRLGRVVDLQYYLMVQPTSSLSIPINMQVSTVLFE